MNFSDLRSRPQSVKLIASMYSMGPNLTQMKNTRGMARNPYAVIDRLAASVMLSRPPSGARPVRRAP